MTVIDHTPLGSAEIDAPQRVLLFLILRRLLAGLVALFVLLTFIYSAIELLPGDAAEMMLGRDATPEAVHALRAALGLDLPFYLRYLHWLGSIAHGDFGKSIASGQPVAALVLSRFWNTVFLAGIAAAIAVPLAVSLGVVCALYRNALFDRAISGISLSLISFPDFFVAYTLILVFSIKLGWFASVAAVTDSMPLTERIFNSVLPALTLVLFVTTHMMRMTRAAIIDVLSRPFIEMAELKGLSPFEVIVRHALPNAWAPIINVIIFNLTYLVLGVVIVEFVFAYPGLGQLLVDSVSKRDVPIVQACSLIFAASFILLNLAADVLAIVANPQLRKFK